ncbi:MAG: lactate utilization protein [Oscillospiraceae bacterium]|jgi:L-lactate utilization protein LutB|nr:lactate utilization protein [Oscillospiraceae bacterium]
MDKNILKENFENHGFITTFLETGQEVVEYLKESVNNTVVGIGGSVTATDLDLYTVLRDTNTVIWHYVSNGMDTRKASSHSTVYILSANGVSQTGELVNIDGSGNRLAYSTFGPERVIYIVGRNKIVPTLEEAIWRAKNIASPLNARRLNRNTPCAVNADRCYDCNSEERICHATLIVERPTVENTEIIFVNQDLGY